MRTLSGGLTRTDIAWLLDMSESWVKLRMQAGDMPRPGRPAPEYVAAFVRYRKQSNG